jgi:hypothetical protein
MKNKELKIIWKLAKKFWIAGTFLWIIETLVFLVIEGWHYKATNKIEIYLDEIVKNMWHFDLFLTVTTCIYFLINLNYKYKQ